MRIIEDSSLQIIGISFQNESIIDVDTDEIYKYREYREYRNGMYLRHLLLFRSNIESLQGSIPLCKWLSEPDENEYHGWQK